MEYKMSNKEINELKEKGLSKEQIAIYKIGYEKLMNYWINGDSEEKPKGLFREVNSKHLECAIKPIIDVEIR